MDNDTPDNPSPCAKMLELLICPISQRRLKYDRKTGELISESAKLAYPIRNGIPIMLAREARKL